MKTLYQYMSNPPVWDCHYHAFSHVGDNKLGPVGDNVVAFADIELDHLDKYKDIKSMYINAISKHKAWIWLATGTNIEDIKDIYKSCDNIQGFGELKLYDEYGGKEIGLKKISFLRQALSFSCECGNLPVYIHYTLKSEQDSTKLERVLQDYPDISIVLCHCGMSHHAMNQDYAYGECARLSAYPNLWFDISFDASKYFVKNPFKLRNLPGDRMIWGSDLNPKISEVSDDPNKIRHDELDNYFNLCKYINTNHNIKELFKCRNY